MPHRLHLAAMVAGIYALGLAVVGMWPHPVDEKVDVTAWAPVRWTTDALGLTPIQGYDVLQFAANVVMFVPFGVLLLLVWRRVGAWQATAAGGAVAALIELLQFLARPERLASMLDVVANTLGAAVGSGVVWVARRRRAP
jgi:glycopeptide antibiotics resistance protein